MPGPKPKALVLSPHADDCAISMGGAVALFQKRYRFSILTLASRSVWAPQSKVHGMVSFVTALRKKEDRNYARTIRARSYSAEIPDLVVRRSIPLEDVAKHLPSPPTRREVILFETALFKWIVKLKPEAIFCPVGMGHTDHIATADALMGLLRKKKVKLPPKGVWFFEDLPYVTYRASNLKIRIQRLEKKGPGQALVSELVRLSPQTMLRKLKGIRVYDSQAPDQYFRSVILWARKLSGKKGYAERFWILG